MDILVQASQTTHSVLFSFNKACKQSNSLEKAIIETTKSILKKLKDPKEITEIHITSDADAEPGRLRVTWSNRLGQTESRPMQEMIAKKDFKELKKLAKDSKERIHIQVNQSQELKEIIEEESPKITEIFHPREISAELTIKKLPEPPHLHQLENAGSEGNQFALFLRRFFTYHLVLRPAVHQHIMDHLEGMSPPYYRSRFFGILKESDLWADRLLQQYPDLDKVYSRDALKELYRKQLIELTNTSLKKARMLPLSVSEVRAFDMKDTVTSCQKEDLASSELEAKLHKIPGKDMPLEELAKIPITPENREVLKNIWIKSVTDVYTTGHFDRLGSVASHKDKLVQTSCALKFIETLHAIPDELFDEINDRLPALGINVTIDQLSSLIIRRGAYLNAKIPLNAATLEKKQKFYQETIKPILDHHLKDFTTPPNPNYKGSATDLALEKLIYILAQGGRLKPFIERSKTEMANQQQPHLFSEEELMNIFYQQVEQIAIDEYAFTATQIDNFREARLQEDLQNSYQRQLIQHLENFKKQGVDNPEALEACVNNILELPIELNRLLTLLAYFQNEDYTPFLLKMLEGLGDRLLNDEMLAILNQETNENKLKKQILEIKQFNKFLEEVHISPPNFIHKLTNYKERVKNYKQNITNEQARELMRKSIVSLSSKNDLELYCNESVTADIEANGFEHPSKISPHAVSLLLKLTYYASLVEQFPKRQLSHKEKEGLANTLAALKDIPNINKILPRFLEKEPPDLVETLVPSVFRNLILPKQEESAHYNPPAGISETALLLAIAHLKMIKNYEQLALQLPKAQALLAKYRRDPSQIKDQDRLSLTELGQISKLARSINVDEKDDTLFALLKDLGLTTHPTLSDFSHKAQEAEQIIQDLEAILLPAFSTQHQDGDILGYSGRRKEAWTGRSMCLEEKMTMHIADYGLVHGMKVYHNEENQLEISHVYGEHEIRPMNLYEACISEGWRVNIAPLIPHECAQELQNIFGPEWANEIQKIYRDTERDIHARNREKNIDIKNDEASRMKAGLADFRRILNFFGGLHGKPVESHHLEEEQDFRELYTRFLNDEDIEDTQICSEFASKATLVALMEVNRKLAKRLANRNPRLVDTNVLRTLQQKKVQMSGDVENYLKGVRHFGVDRYRTKEAEKELRKVLKEQGFSKRQILLFFRINNKEVFDLPYSRKENLTKIHPGRMISLLEKKKCVHKIKRPEAFQRLIK